MGPVQRRVMLVVAATILVVSATIAVATSLVPLPTMKDLAQVWMGGDRSHIWYSRLELNESGGGTLIIQYLPMYPPQAYRVTRTRLAQYDLELKVVPIDADAEPVYVRGKAYPGRLELKIGGRSGKWESQVTFDTSVRIMTQIEALNRRASDLSVTKRK
jgi:hypothetical protein